MHGAMTQSSGNGDHNLQALVATAQRWRGQDHYDDTPELKKLKLAGNITAGWEQQAIADIPMVWGDIRVYLVKLADKQDFMS